MTVPSAFATAVAPGGAHGGDAGGAELIAVDVGVVGEDRHIDAAALVDVVAVADGGEGVVVHRVDTDGDRRGTRRSWRCRPRRCRSA